MLNEELLRSGCVVWEEAGGGVEVDDGAAVAVINDDTAPVVLMIAALIKPKALSRSQNASFGSGTAAPTTVTDWTHA